MDLEKGYTRPEARPRGRGLYSGTQDFPAGDAHAVVRGEPESLCGEFIRKRLAWPPGSMERLCPRCAERLLEMESRPT